MKKNEPVIHLVNEFASMTLGLNPFTTQSCRTKSHPGRSQPCVLCESLGDDSLSSTDTTACTDCICNHMTNQHLLSSEWLYPIACRSTFIYVHGCCRPEVRHLHKDTRLILRFRTLNQLKSDGTSNPPSELLAVLSR